MELRGAPNEPDSSTLSVLEVEDKMGKPLFGALNLGVVFFVRAGRMSQHHRRARQDDVYSLGEGGREDVRGDSPGVHG
jgi:hypothetical protein